MRTRSRSVAIIAGVTVAAALVLVPNPGRADPRARRSVLAPAGAPTPVARLRAALAVQRRHQSSLMGVRGVVGTGTGLDPDGEPVIRVFTERDGVALPSQLEGVRVRARKTGRFHARRGVTCDVGGDGVCQTTERWPLPVPIGASIGHPDITAGTLGCRVTDGTEVYGLSNNHVLANSNGATLGDPELQPGPFDGGSEAAGDAIGTLHDFEPIAFCNPYPLCADNFFDAALMLTTPAELGVATSLGEYGSSVGYGVPNPLIHPIYGDPALIGDEDMTQFLGLPVQKQGRTTGLTAGAIDTIGMAADVCYDQACTLIAHFEDQFNVPGAFSGGGDSGSLVVSDDVFKHPVGLLFAGSESSTIVSPLDRVLLRFGVTVDDAGLTVPFSDAELVAVTPPSFPVAGQAATVSVDVRNAGTEPLPPFDVILRDDTESSQSTLTVPALNPGAATRLDFVWTPSQVGAHVLRATLQISDDDGGNDERSVVSQVLLEPPDSLLQLWKGTVRTDAWTTVDLGVDYADQMVVVCTPQYDVSALGTLVARVRNAAGTSFEVGLGRPWFGAFPGDDGSAEMHCLALRAGVYTKADDGVQMEAVRIEGFAGKDDSTTWSGTPRAYAQAYVNPVVVGQVISSGAGLPGDLGVWSVFWARGATVLDPPSAASLFVGRHTAEDPTLRGPETLAYLVIESGSGKIDGHAYTAKVGPDSVQGVDDAPPYAVPYPALATTTHAVASSAGMDGVEGGWPILYGPGALTGPDLGLAIEEDWWWDAERSHPTEQVAVLVFGTRKLCGLGFELVLLAPLLRRLGRRRNSVARERRAR